MKMLTVFFLLVGAATDYASDKTIHCIDDTQTSTHGPTIRDIR